MKRYILRAALALALVLAFYGAAVAAQASQQPLELLDYKGLQTMLAANKGKVVAVNFFASWCPPCREEVPGLMRIRKDFSEDTLLLIGASLDDSDAKLQEYMDKTKFNYPIMKAGLDLAGAAGVTGIPHILIFDAQGEVAANQGGLVPEEDLRAFFTKLMEKK